ncbi:hypothetical protein GCM10016234_16060 [Tianweitania populi]|uniref:Uncharacterized protein n=1 Tax=Tianweitania populi TaxID=1607949 RepID=A0A8J3DQM2_9HYPH|nr:hypothetical protein GCM10016234_16060 [Tianweitania populi]
MKPREKRKAERLFKQVYLTAHGGLRDPKFFGGMRKTVQARGGFEDHQRRYWW